MSARYYMFCSSKTFEACEGDITPLKVLRVHENYVDGSHLLYVEDDAAPAHFEDWVVTPIFDLDENGRVTVAARERHDSPGPPVGFGDPTSEEVRGPESPDRR